MYPNPLLPGFNPDPTCVCVGGVYWAVTSTFEYLPALPVYRSEDLIHWTHVNNVAPNNEQVGLGSTVPGFGVWAPTIRYHDGRFYLIVVITGSTRTCVLFTSEDPAGTWNDGVDIEGIDGIDPDLAWDEHGNAYITYSALRLNDPSGWSHHGIEQVRIDLETGKRLEEPRTLWSGTGLTAPEGPRLYRRGDHWFLLIAEGGTGRGHSVSVARGPSLQGPFSGAPTNPILTASGTDRPVISTGHGDLVTAPDGSDVLILLGTRTVDAVGAFSPIGRETFITPVEWVDGWPAPAPVALGPSQAVEEEFDFATNEQLDEPGWLAVNRRPRDVARIDQTGFLTIPAEPDGLAARRPSFVGRRQRHLLCTVETSVSTSKGSGGLAVRWDEQSWLSLVASRRAGRNVVTARVGTPSLTKEWQYELSSPKSTVELRIETCEPNVGDAPWTGGADRIKLSVEDGENGWHELADLDGRYLSVEAATGFSGRVVGLYSEDGIAQFGRFTYSGQDRS